MALNNFCPGPAHILKPLHPKYNKDATYDSYVNALKPEMLPAVTMGPWVPVGYKPDEIIIMRRNPYFIEVDDQGNQLPYLDEISFKLSTWEDRTIQTVAGTADYTNMEDPNLYLESLKKVAEPDFPEQPVLERAVAVMARRLQPVDGLRRGQRCRQGQARALPADRFPPCR